MENGICGAFDCTNVIRGRRSNSKYCSNACKTRHSRYNKSNGITTASIGSTKVPYSGSVVTDVATSSLNVGLKNAINDNPLNTGLGASALGATVPYLGECVKKRPITSIFVGLLGFYASGSVLRSCTTTIKGNKRTKECKDATGIQKAGAAAAALLAFSYICDNWAVIKGNIASVTDVKRYSNVTVTERNAYIPSITDDVIAKMNANPPILFKAN